MVGANMSQKKPHRSQPRIRRASIRLVVGGRRDSPRGGRRHDRQETSTRARASKRWPRVLTEQRPEEASLPRAHAEGDQRVVAQGGGEEETARARLPVEHLQLAQVERLRLGDELPVPANQPGAIRMAHQELRLQHLVRADAPGPDETRQAEARREDLRRGGPRSGRRRARSSRRRRPRRGRSRCWSRRRGDCTRRSPRPRRLPRRSAPGRRGAPVRWSASARRCPSAEPGRARSRRSRG